MKIVLFLSDFILPVIIFYILAVAVIHKIKVYETFLDGVKEGLHIVVQILPTLIALMVSVGVLRASGIFEWLQKGAEQIFAGCLNEEGMFVMGSIALPIAVLPVFFLRLFSSSAATGLLLDLFKQYGADSLTGFMASISLSCTEAVLYCLSVYFTTVGITKVKWTLKGALIATLAGIVASVILANVWKMGL